MISRTYQITIFGASGAKYTGTLSYEVPSASAAAVALPDLPKLSVEQLAHAGPLEIPVTEFAAAGQLKAKDLTGQSEYTLKQGRFFVTKDQVPLVMFLSGETTASGLGLQFNRLDSDSYNVGGSLSWYPSGFNKEVVPLCFVGIRQT
ncbi:hypothetical protein BLA18110_02371 [Burkholderia lata]|uniref:hypothetical protein n=1 Tax=Burkholderia lata (strain ATCC 17760 / DSM 23089 / LMG 22485 / NCIMB 9086 / R18194 / 383) TaxID=482957 RepID=UPI0014536FD7|nr:hypothetical protein [Burkholderia lata]VWC75913.1 hypothetical protein BLA18110_02371 [Burkholderia lata]